MILSKQSNILWNWYPTITINGPFTSSQVITMVDDAGVVLTPADSSTDYVKYKITRVGNYTFHVDNFSSIIEINSTDCSQVYQYKPREYDPKTLLLLDADQGIKDISMYNVPLTNNGFGTTPTYKKNGNNCFINLTTTNYIDIPNFGVETTRDWTVEAWEYYPSSFVTTHTGGALFGLNGVSSYTGMIFCHQYHTNGSYNGNLYYLSSNNSSWNLLDAMLGTDEMNDRWYHIAMVRQGNYYKFYCDGKYQWGTTNGTDIMNKASFNHCRIGGYASGAGWIGCFDDLRVSQCARYNDAFEVPKRKLTPYIEERLYRLE